MVGDNKPHNPKMSRIVYLIQAHHEPDLCIRLIERLQGPNAAFFIHWDQKSESEAAKVIQYASSQNNVHLFSEFKMYWMGYSLVGATILLMQKAIESGFDFKYAVLLSGQDYPIKSKENIHGFFDQHSRDFISFNRLDRLGNKYLRKIESHHFLENSLWNPKSTTKNKWLHKLYFGGYYGRLIKYLPKRKMYNGWTAYFGSQWFAFTQNTVSHILDYLAHNPQYVSFMKTVEAPDEIFFQTLLGNTALRGNISEIEDHDAFVQENPEPKPYLYHWGSLHFMDWESPDRAKPALLDSRDFNSLKHSNLLFCRKVTLKEQSATQLLDTLDKEILSTNY